MVSAVCQTARISSSVRVRFRARSLAIAAGHSPDNGTAKVVIPSGVPVQDPPNDHQNQIRHRRTALVLNLVQQCHNIPAPDLVDRLVAKGRVNQPLKDRFPLVHGSNLRAFPLHVLFGDGAEFALYRSLRLLGLFLGDRIGALGDIALNDIRPLVSIRQFRGAAEARAPGISFVIPILKYKAAIALGVTIKPKPGRFSSQ